MNSPSETRWTSWSENPRWRRAWDVSFSVASILSSFLMGVAFGNVIWSNVNMQPCFFRLAEIAGLIKVMATGGRFTKGSKPLAPQFELPVLTDIVDYARQKGLTVAAHCHGTPGIEAAVRAGVHSVEHCSWVGDGGWDSVV